MSVKIVKLTALNVDALNRMIEFTDTDQVTTTKTTATFDVANAVQALDILNWFQTRAAAEFGKTSGPYPALHAVRRKLDALAAQDILDAEKEAHAVQSLRTLAIEVQHEMAAEIDAQRDAATTVVPAAIRPKAWVTAHVTDLAEPVAEVSGAVATVTERGREASEAFARYRAARRGSSAAPGRLLAASKTGQRRPKRGRK